MAPILIDNRNLIKLGLFAVLTTVIVFAAGFFSGYQQATTFYASGSEIETLALPVRAVLLESDVEPQLPDTVVAGAEIDVDQPHAEPQSNAKNSAVEAKTLSSSNKEKVNKAKQAPASNKLASSEPVSFEQTGKPSKKVSSDDKNNFNNDNLSSIKNKVALNRFQNEAGKSVTTQGPDFLLVTSLTSAELSNIRYSIQVGTFGRLVNAENMMRLLQAQHLDAYVSDYLNKKNENRYNVRFGYFADKKSALSALTKYKNTQKGDGYLVNFSVENITNLAEAKNLKAVSTVEKIKKNTSPETVQDNISGVDAKTAADVLVKAL